MMQTQPLSEDFKDRLIKFYKSIDCKYFVFKIEDLVNSINEYNYLTFINIIDDYNKYREENNKPENKYFVINRDDTRFDKAKDFFEWFNNKSKQ